QRARRDPCPDLHRESLLGKPESARMASSLQFLLLDRQTIMTERALLGQVVGGLRALSTEIDRLDQAAADRDGPNRTAMRARALRARSAPLAPTALARLLGFTTGGVTTVLDRLEKAGYIRRRPDPGDRRRQLVANTEATAAPGEGGLRGLHR